jgi:hypothetical protein
VREKIVTGHEADSRVQQWLAALDQRHLANLTPAEVARALRALSSCYVERRAALAEGGALGTAGKRAAFALFYAPLHLLTVGAVIRTLGIGPDRVAALLDLGCGTGSAGAAWALETAGARVTGIDRHPWAVREAIWTYRQLGIDGRAIQRDVSRVHVEPDPKTGIVAAYAMNELSGPARAAMLAQFLRARARGVAVLIVEPLARGVTPWWKTWEDAFTRAGGRTDEWRFPAVLPPRQRDLARAAGLRPRELTARTLFLD